MGKDEARAEAKWQEPTTIKTVTYSGSDPYDSTYDIQMEDSVGFMMKDEYHVVPKVGDTIQLKTKNFSTVAGVKLNGKILYEKTDEQLDQEHYEYCQNQEKTKKETFEKNKVQQDADYEALPPVFKRRIDRFRANNPNFRWDIEPYVLFASKEAVKILKVCKTVEELSAFHKMSYEEQKAKAGIDEGHSGGTFGEAMQLAHAYVENEKYVPYIHSSLAHIAGCDKVGCLPPTEDELKELGV